MRKLRRASAPLLCNKHMVAADRGPECGTSAACASRLFSRRARAATAAAAYVLPVVQHDGVPRLDFNGLPLYQRAP